MEGGVRRQFEELSVRNGVACIQEARVVPEGAQHLPTSHKHYVNQLDVFVPGSASALRLVRASGAAFNAIGLHMDPKQAMGDKMRLLARLNGQVDQLKHESIFMLGEWNFVGAEDVRLSMGSESSGGGDPIAPVLDAMIPEFAVLWQTYPAFRRRGGRRIVGAEARPGVYTNVSEVEAGQCFGQWLPADRGMQTPERSASGASIKRSRTARLPRIASDLVRADECHACLVWLAKGIGRIEQLDGRCLSRSHPGLRARRLSQPDLLAEAPS